MKLETSSKCWAFGPSQYIQELVGISVSVKERHEKKNIFYKYFLPKTSAKGLLSNRYRPEIDVTPELNANDAAYY